MDEQAAVEGLKRLGLSTYEARVFLGLQKLGEGTAADVTEVVDVPRSQVYGAAEGLEERGLIETRQATPTVYRPVAPERARTRLLDDLARTGDRTFEYVESVRATAADGAEGEAIWLVRGREAVAGKVADLAGGADERLVLGVPDVDHLDAQVIEALEARAEAGVAVTIASADPEAVSTVRAETAVDAWEIPEEPDPDVRAGRVLLVDDRTALLSVYSRAAGDDAFEEVAFWSADSAFGAVLGEVVGRWFRLASE